MPDTAFAKVEDAVKAVLDTLTGTGEALEDWTVLTEHSADEAVEGGKRVAIYTVAATPEVAQELGQTFWAQTIEIEFINTAQASGSISRANMEVMAGVHAALAADRTLGGRLQDLQEIDLAGVQAEGKDADAASVQYRAEFYTARGEWLTILGHSGATF